VRVWHPGELPDRFGARSREAIGAALASDPGTVVVQYVPAAFGLRGLNLPFCSWIARLARQGVDVRVMFHEPFFYFGLRRPWRNALALVQRVMAKTLLRGATRVYYSTETWTRLLARYGPPATAEVLPIPATIPTDVPAHAVAAARARRRAPFVIGHFGTYGQHVTGELSRILPELLARLPHAHVLLAGRGAQRFAATLEAEARARVEIVDAADGEVIGAALRACNVLVQPYPDGVTTRRTSMMAALTTGVPVVTTQGPLTEAVWTESGAVALGPAEDAKGFVDCVAQLATDVEERTNLGMRGRRLYDERFALHVTLSRIRRA
jgi:glycosyltransferase involved in cell wall biosynthesis